MKNLFAEAIENGSGRLSFREFRENLMKDIINDHGLYDWIEHPEKESPIVVTKNDDAIENLEPVDTETEDINEDQKMEKFIENIKENVDLIAYNIIYFNFYVYLNIIVMLAAGHDDKEITYILMNRMQLPMEEKGIRMHIERVKSTYGTHVELFEAILKAKIKDFIKLGASPQQAIDCVNDWMHHELG